MRTRIPRRTAFGLMLAGPLALAQKQKKSPVNGSWVITAGSQTFRVTFEEDQGDVSGTLTLPDGQALEIEYGLVIGNDLEFTTVENGVEFEWTAEVSKNSIKGERVNLDEETTVRFTAKRTR